MGVYAGSRLEASDEPSAQLLAKANKVFVNGRCSNNGVEKLVVEVEIRLPAAEKNADQDTKTLMVAKLIKQLKMHLGPLEKPDSLEQPRGSDHFLRTAREFLRKDDGTKWVQSWFDQAPTGNTNVAYASPAPTVAVPHTLATPTRDEGRNRRASLYNIINQPPLDEHLLRWMTLEPRLRDATMSRPSLAASPTEAMAFQTVIEDRRLSAGLAVRQEHAAMSHRRSDSAGDPMLRPCHGCGMVHGTHGSPITPTTIIVLPPFGKRAICFYLFLFFWPFVFFFYGGRASSKP